MSEHNDKYIYEIEIPANCTAEIVLPNDEKHAVKAGEYSFWILTANGVCPSKEDKYESLYDRRHRTARQSGCGIVD